MDCKNTKTTERDLIVSHRLVKMVRRLNDRAKRHKIANIVTLCTHIKCFLTTSQIQNFLSYLVNMILTSVLLSIHFFYPDVSDIHSLHFRYASLYVLPNFVFPTKTACLI